jgi:hypothetical protein
VREAVLENRAQTALSRYAALQRSSDLTLAEAALAAQLIELEALLSDDVGPSNRQVLQLLDSGYTLLGKGFAEARRLDALASGDGARAEYERRRGVEAQARASEYRRLGGGAARDEWPSQYLNRAESACGARDQAGYEAGLHELLRRAPGESRERLRLSLAQRLAAAWLLPEVAARCRFDPRPSPGAVPAAAR